MTRRIGIVFLAFALILPACGEAGSDAREMREALGRTRSRPHRYVYTETAGGRDIDVEVMVQDSFRSRTELSLDGVRLLEQVVVDDAAAIRLGAPERWNPGEGTPLESILGSGQWVVDPAGAPALLLAEEGSGDITDVGNDPILDAVNVLDYAQAAADQSKEVIRFDKNSIEYRPALDPFRDLVDADDREGIVRYDAVPPDLPRTAEGQRGAEEIPGTQFFRKLSVYVKDDRVVRVLENIDFESHEEIVKAKERGRPRFLLDVLVGLRRGVGDDPVRSRQMATEIEVLDRSERVELPSDARTANIGQLLESAALSKLPGSEGRERADGQDRREDGRDVGSQDDLPRPTPGEGERG